MSPMSPMSPMSMMTVDLLETMAEPITSALIHSVWQGGLAAILLAVALAFIGRRRARLRYALSCAALAATATSAAVTLWFLMDVSPASSFLDATTTGSGVSRPSSAVPQSLDVAAVSIPFVEIDRRAVAPWLFVLWIAGVGLMSAYHLFLWGRTRALARSGVRLAGEAWRQRTDRLSRLIGLSTSVRLLESVRVDVPCVVGWVRPIVLVPGSAFCGVSPEQLELILAHELAHIRRYDVLVNYLQTLVETLLFHNPPVWWISRQIRIEREHCCDDAAALIAGPTVYARALLAMERLRRPEPSFSMAAGGMSLLARVRRLLRRPAGRNPSSGLGNLVTVSALIGLAILIVEWHEPKSALAAGTFQEPVGHVTPSTDLEGRWVLEQRDERLTLAMRRGADDRVSFTLGPEELQGLAEGANTTFRLVRDAGTIVFEGELKRVAGSLTGSGRWTFQSNEIYGRELLGLGFARPSKEESFELALHDVTLDFVRGLDEAGYRGFSLSKLIELAIHDVTPGYIEELADLGYHDMSLDRLVEMRIHDVTPDFIRELKELGYESLPPSKLVEMQIHDVDGDFVRRLAELGYRDSSPSELVEMKIHDVTPAYIRELRELGYRDLSESKLVEMRIHDVTPDFIREAEKRGYRDLTPSRLIELAIHGLDR